MATTNVRPFPSPRQSMARELRRVSDALKAAVSSGPEDAFLLTIDSDGIIGVRWMGGPTNDGALRMVGALRLIETQILEAIQSANDECTCDNDNGDVN